MPPAIEKAPVKTPSPIIPMEIKPPPYNWPEAVVNTIERVRSIGKNTGESETIVNKMVEAIKNHDPQNGDIVVVDVGEGQQFFQAITIQN